MSTIPKLKVIKKDKSIENFDPNKIIASYKNAGASDEIAKNVARKVEEKLYIISVNRILSLTIEKLKELDKESGLNIIKYNIENANIQESKYEETQRL